MENCLLYDWFTCSFKNVEFTDLLYFLGLHEKPWQEKSTRLHYAKRLCFDGISIHYSPEDDLIHEKGCCLEMSGQGCRDFDTFSDCSWQELFDFVKATDGHITRLDIAYDDFTGVLNVQTMAAFARNFWFTARSQKIRIMEESEDGEPDHMGFSVCHGSKSSNIYIRCYDKRVEKHAWDIPHWVRFEVQLRADNCEGFVSAPGGLGPRFGGVITNYLNYRCPSEDSNKRRWPVCPWWSRFLGDVERLSVHQKKDVEYNKDRLDAHIYDRNHNAIKSEILTDGLSSFVSRIFGHTEELPPKYDTIIRASKNADDILRILGETSPAGQIVTVSRDIENLFDSLAINPFGLESCG